jgi:hypothetical protein
MDLTRAEIMGWWHPGGLVASRAPGARLVEAPEEESMAATGSEPIFGIVLAAMAALTPATAIAAETVTGSFALAGAEARVTGEMTVTETGPLSADVTVTFADARTGEQVVDFTEELTQELHLLAIDRTLSRLVHEHVKTAGEDGVFSAALQFPGPGLYHI